MQIRALSGFTEDQYNQFGKTYSPINGISTTTKIPTKNHNLLKVSLATARGFFLLLVKANVWGLASIISSAKKNPAADAAWKVAWWNLGGSDSELFSIASGSKTKKAILIKAAPQKIKDKLRQIGISGISSIVGLGGVEVKDLNEGSTSDEKPWIETVEKAAVIVAALVDLIAGTLGSINPNILNYSNGIPDDIKPPTEDEYSVEIDFKMLAIIAGIIYFLKK